MAAEIDVDLKNSGNAFAPFSRSDVHGTGRLKLKIQEIYGIT
jgi:hypothetical protein